MGANGNGWRNDTAADRSLQLDRFRWSPIALDAPYPAPLTIVQRDGERIEAMRLCCYASLSTSPVVRYLSLTHCAKVQNVCHHSTVSTMRKCR